MMTSPVLPQRRPSGFTMIEPITVMLVVGILAIYRVTATTGSRPVAGWIAATIAWPNTINLGTLYVERRIEVTFR